jgi:tRNA 2-thiouridine synthesizing protein B
VSSLHTVNKSSSSADVLSSCLRTAVAGDTVLLIEDGVYACGGSQSDLLLFSELDPAVRLCALQEDVQARGIKLSENVHRRIEAISYPQFVELACQHTRTISWF